MIPYTDLASKLNEPARFGIQGDFTMGYNLHVRAFCCGILATYLFLLCPLSCFGQVNVLVDQVGYETQATKQAIIEGGSEDHPQRFSLIELDTGKPVYEASLQPSGTVHAWGSRMYWTADFSSWHAPGHYALEVSGLKAARSCAFEIGDNML